MMDLYDDLVLESFFDADTQDNILQTIKNSKSLSASYRSDDKAISCDQEIGEDEAYHLLTCCVKHTPSNSYFTDKLLELTFSAMPGLCSTVVVSDLFVHRNKLELTKLLVDRIDEVLEYSGYSCALYTLIDSQRNLRKALEDIGFQVVPTLTHINKRTDNRIFTLYKFYNQRNPAVAKVFE